VDFSTGRESIVTAPGAGTATEIEVYAFPLFKPMAKAGQGASTAPINQPRNTASFIPFGKERLYSKYRSYFGDDVTPTLTLARFVPA